MKSNPKQIEELLSESDVGLKNAKTHEEIKKEISAHGYSEAKIDEILTIHDSLSAKYQEFEKLSGQQLSFTLEKDKLYHEEQDHYSFYRQMIAKAFDSDEYKGLRSQLGIDRRIKKSLEGFIEQARQFYEGALNNQGVLEEKNLSTVQLTAEVIQERLNALGDLRIKDEEQESIKGKARVARNERDVLYRNLRVAWESFKISCRKLFKEKEEYLTILNIKPRKKRKVEKPEEPETPGTSGVPGGESSGTPPAVKPDPVNCPVTASLPAGSLQEQPKE
jgi:hypothetical protein